MSEGECYRARFRFRLQKKLNINTIKHDFHVGGSVVTLSSADDVSEIRNSEWLVMNARQFDSEPQAKEFARRLKFACEVSSVCTRLGIDTGINVPTCGLGGFVKDQLHASSGVLVRDNVHGIDVFPDNPNVRTFSLQGGATVHASAERFLNEIPLYFGQVDSASEKCNELVLLLNYALLRPEPVTRLVFSISAVEMLGQSLGQNRKWSIAQQALLAELAESAYGAVHCSESERREIADSIERMHRLSLSQGVFRLLESLGLEDLKKKWKALYAERSTLIHGLAPKPGADYSGLAERAVSLCGYILLKAISKEVQGADKHVESVYQPA